MVCTASSLGEMVCDPGIAWDDGFRFCDELSRMSTHTQSAFTKITVELSPPAARIVLHNPPLNVIDIPMMEQLRAVLEQVEQNPDISATVFIGSKRAFSTGVDVAAHAPGQVHVMLGMLHSVIRSIVSSKKLTVAGVCGHCLGGGAELAMMCDVVYASPGSVWGFPEIKLACFPPVASVALAAIVGQKLAAEMVLTGRTMTGTEALAAGLVNGVADDPETLVSECLQRVSQLSPVAIAHAKRAFYAWDSIHLDKGLARAEQIYLDELMRTADAREGVAAFLEHRQPKWTGK